MKTSGQPEARRKHRLTRLGFHFLFVGAFAMLGGALRGFNLLLVLAGILVGALITQWRWSRRSVDATSVQRRLPTEAFAGNSFRVRYRLGNQSRILPVWMMRVEDRIESADQTEKAVAVCGAGVISPQQAVVAHCDCVIARRGRYRLGPISLITTFPFSLFTSQLVMNDQAELHVYPRLVTLRPRWQQRLTKRGGGVATTARRSGFVDGEFFGLREWQTGDSPRWIHWRTTARLNEPAVRQFEQQRRFDVCVLVDAYRQVASEAASPKPDGSSPEFGQTLGNSGIQGDQSGVEMAISLAATFLVHLIGSPSNRVVLAVAGSRADAVIGGGSSEGRRRMLEMLAGLETTEQPRVDEAARRAIQVVGRARDLIVVSPRSFEDVKQCESTVAQTFMPWVRRGSLRWINVNDPSLDHWIFRDSRSTAKVARDDRDKALTLMSNEVT